MVKDRDAISRRGVLKHGALATGALVVGATGTATAGIGDGRILDFHLNNINYDREKGTVVAGHVHDASTEKNDGEWYDSDIDPVVSGAVGNAFAFRGEEYITVPDDSSLRLDGSFTAAAWVKFAASSPSPNDYEFFLAKRGTDEEYQVYYSKAQSQLKYYDGEDIYGLNLDLATETWHHLAWVFDSGDFVGYHNGNEIGRTSASAPQTGESDLYVGKDNVGNSIKALNDEVRLYNRALSSSEITELATMNEE